MGGVRDRRSTEASPVIKLLSNPKHSDVAQLVGEYLAGALHPSATGSPAELKQMLARSPSAALAGRLSAAA
jgi:hypothetical protein